MGAANVNFPIKLFLDRTYYLFQAKVWIPRKWKRNYSLLGLENSTWILLLRFIHKQIIQYKVNVQKVCVYAWRIWKCVLISRVIRIKIQMPTLTLHGVNSCKISQLHWFQNSLRFEVLYVSYKCLKKLKKIVNQAVVIICLLLDYADSLGCKSSVKLNWILRSKEKANDNYRLKPLGV